MTERSDPLATDVLVARWQAGDAAAFQALYPRFAPLLLIRVRRSRMWPFVESQCQIDDVVQDIWLRAADTVQKSYAPSGPGSFQSFLGTLADRSLIDLARRHQAARRGDGNAQNQLRTNWERSARPKPGAPPEETPTSHARRSELETIARQALSDREFLAWSLVEIQGFAADEAGLAMRCSASAVRGLLLRARTKLVARLGDHHSEK